MPMNDNDNASRRGATLTSSDSHGQAALLLVESLIHGLCENSTLSNAQAVEITQTAVDVQLDQAEAADGAGAPMWRSHAMLSAILASLRLDGCGLPARPRLV
ncbi:hypothetical protein EAH79_01455 [Sphingomonas koreensis]|nr:hypothetical protein EAH79_01455 [Sphingomonas koreensis]